MKDKFAFLFSLLSILIVFTTSLTIPTVALAQGIDIPENPITFNASIEPAVVRPGEEIRVVISTKILDGWHIYSLIKSDDSPIPPTKISWNKTSLVSKGPAYETNPIVQFDPVIEAILGYHENNARFYQNFKVPGQLKPGENILEGSVRYQVCDERICLLPETETIKVSYKSENLPPRAEYAFMNRTIDDLPKNGSLLPQADTLDNALSGGLLPFILLAITMGMVAWLTPCVFPMVPITVSFFSKQAEKNHNRLFSLALIFSLGIVITYSGIGLIVTAIVGVAGAANLASNPWINLAIAGLFTVFAISLMGVFEMQLPSGLLQRVDAASRGNKGYLGAILMGTAFTLTAFTCTIQFVGTLLVAAAQGEWMWPIIGMLIFSTVFAFPFLLLALFPGWISRINNKAGSWMIKLKFILGLLELLAVTKFLSNADLVWGWGILNREVVLTIWAILLLAISFIIINIIPVPGYQREKSRLQHWIPAGLFLALTIYFGQGVTGKTLDGWTESFLPPRINTGNRPIIEQADNGFHDEDLLWLGNLEEGLFQAKNDRKPILLDFTGYTCINCRWMEKNVFVQTDVYQRLEKNFVKVRLYTDGGDGHEENQQLQIQRFKTIALPFYVILSPENAILAKTSGILSPKDFVKFLDSAEF